MKAEHGLRSVILVSAQDPHPEEDKVSSPPLLVVILQSSSPKGLKLLNVAHMPLAIELPQDPRQLTS